jgi:hypothetical protein
MKPLDDRIDVIVGLLELIVEPRLRYEAFDVASLNDHFHGAGDPVSDSRRRSVKGC